MCLCVCECAWAYVTPSVPSPTPEYCAHPYASHLFAVAVVTEVCGAPAVPRGHAAAKLALVLYRLRAMFRAGILDTYHHHHRHTHTHTLTFETDVAVKHACMYPESS